MSRCITLAVLLAVSATVLEMGSLSTVFAEGRRKAKEEVKADVDYYAVLGLSEDATDKDIKTAFRELSRKYHPDVNRADEAREMHAKVSRAHEVLSDRQKRKMYDIRGEEGLEMLNKHNQMQHHRPQHQDPFASLFGGGGGGGSLKGQDSRSNVDIPLRDIYNGATHVLTVQKQKICKVCKGSGGAKGSEMKTCSQCNGAGHITQRIQLAPGFVQQSQGPCPKCGGKGKEIKQKCPACRGKRVERGSSQLSLVVDRGAPEGHEVRFEMEADQNPDNIPGDVILAIHAKPDDVFTRKGNDLFMRLEISLKEALLGFDRTFPHMDNRQIPISATGVSQHGTVRRIANEGMPIMGGGKGDLYVTIEFVSPKTLTEAQEKVIDTLF